MWIKPFQVSGLPALPSAAAGHHGEDNIDFLTSAATMSLLLFLLLQHRRYPNKQHLSLPSHNVCPPRPRDAYSDTPKTLLSETKGAEFWGENLPGEIVRMLRVQPRYEGASPHHGSPGSSFCLPWSWSSGLCGLLHRGLQGYRAGSLGLEAGQREAMTDFSGLGK